MNIRRKVVAFGVFDGIHDGHRDLFRQARELGDELVVIVGRDETAGKLKGKKPKYTEDERIRRVRREPLVNDAILGDRELSTYTVLGQCKPDVVCLGYDQNELEADLQRWIAEQRKHIELHKAKPYQEVTFHNSLIQKS